MRKMAGIFLFVMNFQAHLVFAALYGYQSQDDIDKNQMIRDQQTIDSLDSWSDSMQRDRTLKQEREYQKTQLQQQALLIQQQQEQQGIAAQQAYIEEQQRAETEVKSILMPIYSTRRNLLDQIAFYMEGRIENKKKFMFNQLVQTEISEKMLQVPIRFEQGEKAIEDTWADIVIVVDMRDYYGRAYREFAQAAETEMKAYRFGAMFWQANAEFEKANAQKDLGFQDAAQAFEKTRVFLLNMGMSTTDPQLLILAKDLDELKTLQSDFKIPKETSDHSKSK